MQLTLLQSSTCIRRMTSFTPREITTYRTANMIDLLRVIQATSTCTFHREITTHSEHPKFKYHKGKEMVSRFRIAICTSQRPIPQISVPSCRVPTPRTPRSRNAYESFSNDPCISSISFPPPLPIHIYVTFRPSNLRPTSGFFSAGFFSSFFSSFSFFTRPLSVCPWPAKCGCSCP
jgi:hypothetical protein